MPKAPSSIPCRTNERILSSSKSVGGLSSNPISWILSVVAPIKDATFVDTPLRSSDSRYSPSVVQSIL